MPHIPFLSLFLTAVNSTTYVGIGLKHTCEEYKIRTKETKLGEGNNKIKYNEKEHKTHLCLLLSVRNERLQSVSSDTSSVHPIHDRTIKCRNIYTGNKNVHHKYGSNTYRYHRN